MSRVEQKLSEAGLSLPPPPQPLAAYVPAKRIGDLVYCSGQIPISRGRLLHTGQVGSDVTLEHGYACARQCALNALAAVKAEVGNLDRVAQVVQVRGFVNSAPGFDRQPEVLNGASDMLVSLFGQAGTHARAAVGVSALPRNAPVEVELVVRLSA
jgi:enamine deaminase RidA (YjgF/YER057c/UK114 family)